MSSDRFVFGVDLDGVVGDFFGGIRPIAAEWLGVPVASLTTEVDYDLNQWKLEAMGTYQDLHRFAVVQRNLFRDMAPIPGAPSALRRLSQRDVRIRIITHRLCIKYFHQEAVAQTTRWLEHHGIPYWDLCFMKDKAAVGADLYVEDAPSNIAELRADGHPTIVFTTSANRHLEGPRADDWSEVEKIVDGHLDSWRGERRRRHLPGM